MSGEHRDPGAGSDSGHQSEQASSARAEVDPGRLLAELDALHSKVTHLEETIDGLRETVTRQEQYIERLEERVSEVDERTELLAHVADASAAAPEQRVAVYLQTLHQEATRNGGTASLTVSEAKSAVGGDIDRTTVYGDFRKVEGLVNSERLTYVRENRGSDRNSRLVYDTDAGTPVGTVAGQRIEGGVVR